MKNFKYLLLFLTCFFVLPNDSTFAKVVFHGGYAFETFKGQKAVAAYVSIFNQSDDKLNIIRIITEIFYNFYDDVLIATSGGNLEVSYEDFLSVQGISVPGNSVLTGNNSDPASCAAVSQYMKNRITQSDTQDFVRRELAEHLNGVNVNDIGEDEDLTGLIRI